MTFNAVDICHRMEPLRMLFSMTLIFIFKVKHFHVMHLLYKVCRQGYPRQICLVSHGLAVKLLCVLIKLYFFGQQCDFVEGCFQTLFKCLHQDWLQCRNVRSDHFLALKICLYVDMFCQMFSLGEESLQRISRSLKGDCVTLFYWISAYVATFCFYLLTNNLYNVC